MIHTVKYKKCTKCLENKKLSQFHNDKYKKLGKKSSCVKCESERKKISYTLNRSIILERGREYKKTKAYKENRHIYDSRYQEKQLKKLGI